jgi:hypothetical protein
MELSLHKFEERKYVGEVIVWDAEPATLEKLKNLYPSFDMWDVEGDLLVRLNHKTNLESDNFYLEVGDCILFDEHSKIVKNFFMTLSNYLRRCGFHSLEEANERFKFNDGFNNPNNGDLYEITRYEGYLWDGTIEMYHALVDEYRYTLYIQPNPEDPTKYDLVKFDYNGCDNCRGTGYQKLFEAKIGDFVDSDFQDVFRVIEGHVYTSSDYGFNGREEGE